MKATEMVKKAAKWYFELAATLYPYPDIAERERKSLHHAHHHDNDD